MLTYISKRLLLMIPTLFGITIVVVAIMLWAPGEPTTIQAMGPSMGASGATKLRSQSMLAAKREMGFFDEEGDKLPFPIAWWRWTTEKLLTLDLGKSTKFHQPVTELLAERVPVTLFLNFVSIMLMYLIAIPIGVYSAVRQHKVDDGIVSTILFVLYSMPSWWVATMLIVCFGSVTVLEIFPIIGLHDSGYERFTLFEYLTDGFMHVFLPIVCLTYGGLAGLSRYMRSGMLEVIRQDYIRTAHAKGVPPRRVIRVHALRNALIPIVTFVGLMLPAMIGGSIIIELIFSINGMGRLGYDAIFSRDYLVVMANTLLAAVLTLVGLLVSDLLYCVVDPRISLD